MHHLRRAWLISLMVLASLWVKEVSLSGCKNTPCLYYTDQANIKAIEIASSTISTVVTNLNSGFAVGVHVKRQLLFWSDIQLKCIKKFNLTSKKTDDVLCAGIGNVVSIDVEWESDLLYWSDSQHHTIEVARTDGSHHKTLLHASRCPGDIVVEPRKGYLFLIDGLSRIQRTTLAGKSQTTIASSFRQVYSLIVDFDSDQIFWIDYDGFNDDVRSADFDGKKRKHIVSLDQVFHIQPLDVTIYGNILYWSSSDKFNGEIGRVNKKTKQNLHSIDGSSGKVKGVAMFDTSRQPKGNEACRKRGLCSHLCLLSPNGFECACPKGAVLLEDGKTCLEINDFLLIAERNRITQIFLDDSFSFTPLQLPKELKPRDVQYDPIEKRVYWSDGKGGNISRAFLNGSAIEVLAQDIVFPRGLAVDYVARNLYWMDHWRIEVAKLDGTHRKELISGNFHYAGGLVLDLNRRYMYWQTYLGPSKIERADMDGKNRTLLITLAHIHGFPRGLALDHWTNRLYWIESNFKQIKYLDLFTLSVHTFWTVFTRPRAITVYRDSLFITDGGGWWFSAALYKANKNTGGYKFIKVLNRPRGITAHSVNESSNYPSSECQNRNGGCSHLCLMSPSGYTCACPAGMALLNNSKTCYEKEFILIVDSMHNSGSGRIFKLTLGPTNNVHQTLRLSGLSSPVAVGYDPQESRVYWTDIGHRQISRAILNGSSQEIIVDKDLVEPEGLVVDSVGRNIYWSDRKKNKIEVSKLDGSYRKKMFDVSGPRDIILDVTAGYLYWTTCDKKPKLERADMDGKNRNVIYSWGRMSPRCPSGLTLDKESNKIYFADEEKFSIDAIDLRTHLIKRVIRRVTSPFGVAVDNTYIYWSEPLSRSLKRTNKTNANDTTTLALDLWSPQDIHIYKDVQTNPGANLCEKNNGWCTHLCLLRPGGYQCACPTVATPGKLCLSSPIIPSFSLPVTSLSLSSLSSSSSSSPSPSLRDANKAKYERNSSSVSAGAVAGATIGSLLLLLLLGLSLNVFRKYRRTNCRQNLHSVNSRMVVLFNNQGFSDIDNLYEGISGNLREHNDYVETDSRICGPPVIDEVDLTKPIHQKASCNYREQVVALPRKPLTKSSDNPLYEQSWYDNHSHNRVSVDGGFHSQYSSPLSSLTEERQKRAINEQALGDRPQNTGVSNPAYGTILRFPSMAEQMSCKGNDREIEKVKDISKQLQQPVERVAANRNTPRILNEPWIPAEIAASKRNIAKGPSRNRQSAVPPTKDKDKTLQELPEVDENKIFHRDKRSAGLACRELPPIPTDEVNGISLTQTSTHYCEINQVYDSPLKILDVRALPSSISSDRANSHASAELLQESDANRPLHLFMSTTEKTERPTQKNESHYLEIQERVEPKPRTNGTRQKTKRQTKTDKKKSKRAQGNGRDRSVSSTHLEQGTRDSANQHDHYTELLGRTPATYACLNRKTRKPQVGKGTKPFCDATDHTFIREETSDYVKLDPRSLTPHNCNGHNSHAPGGTQGIREDVATSRQPGNEPRSRNEKTKGVDSENRTVLMLKDCAEKE